MIVFWAEIMLFPQVFKTGEVARTKKRESSVPTAIGLINLMRRRIQSFGTKAQSRHLPPERKAGCLNNCVARPMHDGASNSILEVPKQRNYWIQFSPDSVIARTERVMIVGSVACEKVLALAEHLATCEAAIDLCDDLDAALATIARSPARWCALIVYLSPGCETGDLVEELATFRDETPTVPVILVGDQTCHKNSCNGLPDVADTTLFEPIELSWFQGYLRLAESGCFERCLHLSGQTVDLTRDVGESLICSATKLEVAL
jgi:hypothetical protein